MGPVNGMTLVPRASNGTKASLDQSDMILEAWGEGFNLGALIIILLILFCNYRVGVLLHKLIFLEVRNTGCGREMSLIIQTLKLVLALWHSTFIFCRDPVYGW